MHNRTMAQLARERPTTPRNLLTVHGLAEQKVRDYGAALTSLIKRASHELGLATDLNPAGGARGNATSSSSRSSDVSEHSVDLNSPLADQKAPSGRALPWSNHAKGNCSSNASTSNSSSGQKRSLESSSFANNARYRGISPQTPHGSSANSLAASVSSKMPISATNPQRGLAPATLRQPPHGPVSQIDASDEDGDAEDYEGESLCRRVSNECDDYGGESISTPREETNNRAAGEHTSEWLKRSDAGWMERNNSSNGHSETAAVTQKKQRREYQKQQQRVGALPWANGKNSSSNAAPSKTGTSVARVSTGDVTVKSFFTPYSSKQSPGGIGRSSDGNGDNSMSLSSSSGSNSGSSSSTAPKFGSKLGEMSTDHTPFNTNGNGSSKNGSDNYSSTSSRKNNATAKNLSDSTTTKRSHEATSEATVPAAVALPHKPAPKVSRFGGLDDLADDSDSDEDNNDGNDNDHNSSSSTGGGDHGNAPQSKPVSSNSAAQKRTPLLAHGASPPSHLTVTGSTDAMNDADEEDPDYATRASLEAALQAGVAARDFLRCASLQKRIDALDVAKVCTCKLYLDGFILRKYHVLWELR